MRIKKTGTPDWDSSAWRCLGVQQAATNRPTGQRGLHPISPNLVTTTTTHTKTSDTDPYIKVRPWKWFNSPSNKYLTWQKESESDFGISPNITPAKTSWRNNNMPYNSNCDLEVLNLLPIVCLRDTHNRLLGILSSFTIVYNKDCCLLPQFCFQAFVCPCSTGFHSLGFSLLPPPEENEYVGAGKLTMKILKIIMWHFIVFT